MSYKFHIEFYAEWRNDRNPLEVYFTEFIPSLRLYNNPYYTGYTTDATFKVTPSTIQIGEEVYLVIEFTHPFPLLRNYLNIYEPKTYTY